MLKHLFISIRPGQWVKNLFVFAPLIFSRNLFVVEHSLTVLAAFGLFCLLTGSVYLLNDLLDIEKDRRHPIKAKRPLPSGRLKPSAAVAAAIVLSIGSLGASYALHAIFGVFATCYFLINVAYSTKLKHVVIVDVMLIAFGFVFRVLAGAAVIDVPATSWLLMCTILLALLLGFAKRRHELVLLNEQADNHRRVLEHYTPYFLDQMIIIVSAATVMSYALYTISPETVAHFKTTKLIYTIPFVLYGIFRYLYLVNLREEGGNPASILLTDRPLFLNIFLWLFTCILIMEGVI